MLACHVFIATSLDGFIARPDGAIDWLDMPGVDVEEHGYEALMAMVDGLIMGRVTYETVLGFDVAWPYTKPVVVMSRSLTGADVPVRLAGKVRIVDGSPGEIVRDLAAEGWTHAYVDGGRVIQSFLRDRLIADMVITTIPVLLGGGIPLFGPLDRDVHLRHVETRSFPSGLVQSKYEVAAPRDG